MMNRAAAGAPPGPLLRGEQLVRSYAGRRVLDVEAVEVRAGEVLAILGPNGAGKSTLVRLLAALERPDAGRLSYKGRAVDRDDAELRRSVAAVMQRPYLWRGTVAANVEFALKARKVPAPERRRRIDAALASLGIARLASAPAQTLSGGEAQRVALARALALAPEILFLDEPTADLDVAVRRQLLDDLERLVRRAAPAIVLVTHDPGEAFALAERVAVLEAGRIVQMGTPTELFEAPATRFVASFTGAEFILSGRVEGLEEGTMSVRLDSGELLEVAGRADPGAAVRVHYRPEDIVVGPVGAPATSARNRFNALVARLHPQGGLVRVRLQADQLSLEAVITRHAMEELALRVGALVTVQIKATALHAFPA